VLLNFKNREDTSVNSSILKELLIEYEKKRLKALQDLDFRKEELYTKFPRLKEIESELNSSSISFAKSMLNANKTLNIEDLKNKINTLKEERNIILKSNNIDLNHLNVWYDCTVCQDTGYITDSHKTNMCNCLKQKLFDLEYNKSNINNIDKDKFSNFNLNLFSDEIDEGKYGETISPRENMKEIKHSVFKFIQNFDNPDEKNLLFSGCTGLGKTFLSNCIVNELIKKGKTVLYQTAPVMLDSLISSMFKNDSSLSNNLLNVDLLVIDDLGTETMNSMKFTELYKIINTRLLNQNGKITKTIISTNLDLQNLFNTYDERLVSRFVGHYNIYHFFGDDIRFKK